MGCAILGVYVEKTKKYKVATFIVTLITLGGSLILMGCLTIGAVWVVTIAAFILGGTLAILPIGVQYAIELTFPISESVSTGIITSSADAFSLVFTYSATALLANWDGERGGYYA